VRFLKGHATGNDFVLLPDPDGELTLSPDLVAGICDRRIGIGGDGVLRVVLAAVDPDAAEQVDDARWFMDYRNADGSTAEMCGNGVRLFARYLVDAGYAAPGWFAVATRAGMRRVHAPDTGDVTVEMGLPTRLDIGPLEVQVAGSRLPARAVSVGNPHAVVVLPDGRLDDLDLSRAPAVQPAAAFPDGVNVEFVEVSAPGSLRMRVFERGAGETHSCGTGACAVAAVAAPEMTSVEVDVPGGRLRILTAPGGEQQLIGPAEIVAEGELTAGLRSPARTR
jgi:diaminopimelate epimerase